MNLSILTYMSYLSQADPQIAQFIQKELSRQKDGLVMIASENFASPAVLEAMGTVLTNKYAEGYPGKRYYGGNQFVDEIETIAIERAKKLFNAEHANVQPHSGSNANLAAYFALLEPGDKVLAMDLASGGHLTHGHKINFSGKYYNFVFYGVNKETGLIDYDQVRALAQKEKPKMILAGFSAYPRKVDFQIFGEITKEVDAYFLADIAHIAGLVATDLHPSPLPYADVVTSTTHKTLRGPRGAFILCKKELAEKIDKAVMPGIQGGPLEHIIAAKAVCFLEATQPEFKEYQKQVIKNAQILAETLMAKGLKLVSGGTDTHLILIDLANTGLSGKPVEAALEEVDIYTNKNLIPFDTRKPLDPSGLRLGTPALTTRGFKEEEMKIIAEMIAKIIHNLGSESIKNEARRKVKELTEKYPLYRALTII